jgi:hypothetical protein
MSWRQVKQSPDELIAAARDRVRFRVRSRVRPRVRLRGRFGVLARFAPSAGFGCSGAVFTSGGVCEKSTSVGSCASGCLALRGLRLRVPAAGRGAVACSLCRRPLSAVAPCCCGALPVALQVNVTAGASVVLADRVVASRRLLLSLARLGRPRPCSAVRCASAIVSWSHTAPPPLSRRMAGRWGNGRRAAGAARGGAR